MTTCTTNPVEIPRESVEFLSLEVFVDGLPTQTFDTAVTPVGVRPTTWTPAATLGADEGVIISGLSPGQYRVWIRYVSGAESIVVHVGNVRVT